MRKALLGVVFASAAVCGHAGAVYNLHLVTDNMPDYTDIRSYVRSVTERWATPQEKCVAIWRWARRSRRQTSCAKDDGRLIWDPILHYNSYGTMNCGVVAALNIACFLQLGYRARYIQLGDHTVSEVSWDDGRTWHLFDSSMSFFCYNHSGAVASCQEIKEAHACELSGGKAEPGHYYFYHGAPQCVSHLGPGGWRFASDQPVLYKRTLANGAESYTTGFSVAKYTQYGRYGRRYILNVRPGESYTRYWKPLDRLLKVPEERKPDYYRPLRGKDPDDQHGLNNIRGNGLWVFEPDLGNPALFHDSAGVATSAKAGGGSAIHPARVGEPGWVVFKVNAANVITSMRIEAEVVCRTPGDSVRLLVSRTAGLSWQEVWRSRETGVQRLSLRLRDQVAGVTEALVKFEMKAARGVGDVGLDRLKLTTITQVNRRTLPRLTLGSNLVRVFADEQAETTVLWPVLHGGRYRETVFAERDVFSTEKPDGIYKATLGSAVNGRECFAVWRLGVPTDITAATLGVVATNRSSASYVALYYSFDGKRFVEFFRKSDGAFPFDKQVLTTVEGSRVPPGARTVFLKCLFFCRSGARTYGMDGIQDVLIRINHKPRQPGLAPFEVTFNWTEHRKSGDITRSHTELVERLPHSYTINTAGFRDPTMNWVRVNLRGYGPKATYGYSDGEDVGTKFEYPRVVYHWGRNLARGKPYSARRPSSRKSKNPDTDGRELTNRIVIAPTDYATSRVVQPASAFWEGGEPVTFVVDLGRESRIEGVRVCTHQPNARYCHPGRVEVAVSRDGREWRDCGTIHHDDLWKPPGDYEAWEHDDDPSYEGLPAGGRLAYRFPLRFARTVRGRYVRFVFHPLPGRGMGISELQVFDRVGVERWRGLGANR